jgi:hypothetical protein
MSSRINHSPSILADDPDAPIAWEVTSIPDELYFNVQKRTQPRPRVQRFATKAEADAQKLQLQRDGYVATAGPVHLDLKVREARNRQRQSSPFGDFCKDWKLTP